jgi:transmembrane sensor
MNNQNIDALIDRYLKGELTKEEVVYVEKWLDSLEDKDAFDALPPQELAASKAAMYTRLTARIDRRNFGWLKIAAAVIVIVIAGYFFMPHRSTTITGVAGNIRKQILSDGSIVWLKGKSTLIFPVSFGNKDRIVTLEGEALFEVAKDAAHPFMIHCGTLTTKVLGTSFNIRNNGRETAVSVLTGKISLRTGTSAEILLSANENAVYSEPQAIIKKTAGTTPHELTKGTEYDMAFNDAGMRDVIHRIEQKFDVDIQLKDSAIANNLITADMTDQSLQKTMEMISQALNLDIQIKGHSILLQPKK